jgi:threonine synthase
VAAIPQLQARGLLKREEKIVIFNTGAAQKYVEAIHVELPLIAQGGPSDWSQIGG